MIKIKKSEERKTRNPLITQETKKIKKIKKKLKNAP